MLFQQNPDQEDARVAFEWIMEMRRESVYDVEIRNVIYDGVIKT
ncbi:hypothetical protein [Mesobacillus foraminis]|nr:hypothetical protein [Mesobacillus foraminis]